MTKTHLEFGVLNFVLSMLVSVFLCVESHQGDASVMLTLKQRLNPPKELGWSDPDPCNWKNVRCSNEKRVTWIQIGRKNLSGILPSDLRNLTALERLDLHFNQISGPLPSLSGLSSLQFLRISHNQFTSIPADFFSGLSCLQSVEIDKNPFSAWEIPDSLRNASMLRNFSAITANITGKIPDFFGRDHFPALTNLHLSFNNLEGGLPPSFAESSIQSLWLNGLKGNNKLTGSIEVLQNMTSLKEVWLHSNAFSGQLPDLSGLKNLQNLNLRDNMFTGPVPATLVSLPALKILNLTNNLLQGPTPKFPNSVAVSMLAQSNSFCLPVPGDCDPRVSILLSIAKSVGYPIRFAENWKGNDPCTSWFGIIYTNLNITTINFQKMGLTGTISPDFSLLVSLQKLVLANSNLTGSIPSELTTLPDLREIDVSNNHLYGEIPKFRTDVIVNTSGNPNIGKKGSPSPGTSGILSGSAPGIIGTSNVSNSGADKSSIGVGGVVGSVIGIISVIFLAGLLAFHIYKTKQKRFGREQNPNTMVIHPRHSGSDPGMVKIAVAGSRVSVGTTNETYRLVSSGLSDIQMVEAGNMVVSIQVLTSATNNFNEENILGRGGFGTVYKGELHDGSKIAVKRMESGMMSGKGVKEFESEIAVLTRVRHRHLVALLGYCLDGNERLLVYEYMAQGSLSRHLFRWKEEGLKPLEWSKRLSIALDVARGVEYLHGLAHQSFIHRDLKPSNILLGDDMSPKVADFGLVRPTSEGKDSIETRLAGTFGYLAPEYAVTGRVTTKVDVFSFGVTLMELITGRKALDESQSEDSMYLETWFRRIHINEDTFREAIDPTIELTEESLASISTVAKLAGHCCEWNPNQRPDMPHAVRVLSSLVEHWMPADHNFQDMYGIDLNMIHSGHFGGNSRASLNRTRRHRSLPSRTTPRPGYSPGLLHANMHSPRPVGVRGRKKNREKLVTWG